MYGSLLQVGAKIKHNIGNKCSSSYEHLFFVMKLNKVKHDNTGINSVDERKTRFGEDRDLQLLAQCETLWENLRYFRRNRERALRFAYGDQWGDYITVNGKRMKERDYVASIGNVALQTNQIKKIITTVAGTWTREKNQPVCHARAREKQEYGDVMSVVLQTNWQRNEMPVLMGSNLEEALVGGLIFARESYERRGGAEEDSWTDICNPNYMFFDAGMKDPRFLDMSCIGEIHDITFNELCHAFAEKPEDFKKLREWYCDEANPLKDNDSIDNSDRHSEKRLTFYTPADSKLCRVFEIWTKERKKCYRLWDKNDGTVAYCDADDKVYLDMVKATNEMRRQSAPSDWTEEDIPYIYGYDKKYPDGTDGFFVDTFWYYRFLTPQGYVILEGESNLPDKGQPYTILAVPFTNGRVNSYINDAIDQNKAINRILTLDDWIRRTGVKGVTYVPRNIIPEDMDYKTFAEQWTSIDGIVYFKPNANGDMPKTFYGNVGTLNTAELVRMMNDLMESSVSVSGAIQGKTPYAGTSAAMYAQQTQNSHTPIALFMEKFSMFVKQVALKKLNNIAAYYTPERYAEIAGQFNIDISAINFSNVGQLEYEVAIVQESEIPNYRMRANDWLMTMVQLGLIPAEDALAIGQFPAGADKLLQMIQSRNQVAQQQQIGSDYETKKNMLTRPTE